jgi:L-amino acid N-acyltransferase YncA
MEQNKLVMQYRRAVESDYSQLEDLQSRNMSSVLNAEEKADGFLSNSFNANQLAEINANLSVIVCVLEDKVLGFLCASTTKFNMPYALPAAMIAKYPETTYRGKPLNSYTSFLGGPICIERTERGKGIFKGLYQKLFEELPRQYEVVVVLISEENQRSFDAHEKIGFEPINKFQYNQKTFDILAAPVTK